MLKLKKETEYALLALGSIRQSKERISLTNIIDDLDLPRRFLARILAKMTATKILASVEGRNGGYTTGENYGKYSVFEFLRLFDEDLDVIYCQNKKCKYEKKCSHRSFFSRKIIGKFEQTLTQFKLEDIFTNA